MIGIDIVQIEQVKGIYQKHGQIFLEKILLPQEIKELPNSKSGNFFKHLGCYIAAKEAIYKAWAKQKLDWKDVLISNINRHPRIRIKGKQLNGQIKLSVAVNAQLAIAQALSRG